MFFPGIICEAAMEASRAEASEREHRLSSKLMTQAQAFGVGWVGKGCPKRQIPTDWLNLKGNDRQLENEPCLVVVSSNFSGGLKQHQPACIWPGYS